MSLEVTTCAHPLTRHAALPCHIAGIKDVNGTLVPEMDNRKGRQAISQRPYHRVCVDAMQQLEIKWEKLEAEVMAKATSSTV